MSLFDDGFDAEDATIIGGIMGFAEESIREEDRLPEDIEEIDDADIAEQNINMKLLRNENPSLFAYVIEKVIEHKRKWAEARRQREQNMRDFNEVQHEIAAMKKSGLEDDDAI